MRSCSLQYIINCRIKVSLKKIRENSLSDILQIQRVVTVLHLKSLQINTGILKDYLIIRHKIICFVPS